MRTIEFVETKNRETKGHVARILENVERMNELIGNFEKRRK